MEMDLLHEPREKYPERQKVLERLIHCIWSEQLFRKELQLENKTLLISSPGWWNLEAGPDFRNAEFFWGGVRHCGDVEIHLHSSDWYQHKHHEDPRYNHVALHVVLYGSDIVCRKHNGQRIPQLELKDHLLEELRLLQQRIPIHQFPFGPESNVRLCRRFLEEHEDSAVVRILDSAGDLRMRRKKERFLERMRAAGFVQAFFEALMEGMGYKQSRYAFRELASRVPLDELLQSDQANRRGIDAMSAILLGTAGLLEELSQMRLQPVDAETAHYVGELFRHWGKVEARFESRRLIGFTWYPSSTRPANFPARRLTAVCAFFHYYRNQLLPLLQAPLQMALEDPGTIRFIFRSWLELFHKPLHIYWSYHYQFDGNKFSAPRRLIGKERSRILIINVVIPALLAYAEDRGEKNLEQLLHLLYRSHPRLCDNSITRLMEQRLFGGIQRARSFICTAHRQQALHHFFYDFCDNRESSCSRCELKHEHPLPRDDS